MKNLPLWVMALGILILGLWTWPQHQSLVVKKTDIERYQTQKETLIVQLKTLQKEKAELLSQAERIQTLMQRFPKNTAQEQLMAELKNLIEASGFSFEVLSFSTGEHQTLAAEVIRVDVSVQGPSSQLLGLLQRIEKSKRLMYLDTLNFNTESVNQVEIVRLNLSIEAFSQMAPK